MITVICVKWGNKYSASHVNKLQEMVSQHLTVDHEFVCLTERPNGLNCRTLDFTSDLIEGWWSKVNMFDQSDMQEWVLYFDLDVIIHENIDCLVQDREKDFYSINDFHYPDVFNSSIMFWNRDKMHGLWKVYEDDPYRYMEIYKGDQDFITDIVKSDDNWAAYPDEWTWSWKWGDVRTNAPVKSKVFHITDQSKVAIFHGRPNPWEITKHDFDQALKKRI